MEARAPLIRAHASTFSQDDLGQVSGHRRCKWAGAKRWINVGFNRQEELFRRRRLIVRARISRFKEGNQSWLIQIKHQSPLPLRRPAAPLPSSILRRRWPRRRAGEALLGGLVGLITKHLK